MQQSCLYDLMRDFDKLKTLYFDTAYCLEGTGMVKTVLLIIGIILIFVGFAVDTRSGSNAAVKWVVRIISIIFGIALVVISLMIFDGMLVLPEQLY